MLSKSNLGFWKIQTCDLQIRPVEEARLVDCGPEFESCGSGWENDFLKVDRGLDWKNQSEMFSSHSNIHFILFDQILIAIFDYI